MRFVRHALLAALLAAMVLPVWSVLRSDRGAVLLGEVIALVVVLGLVVPLLVLIVVAPRTRPPVSLSIDGGALVVKVRGPYRVLALWRGPVVPLAHVRSARAVADARRLPRGFRVGTDMPGGTLAGSFGSGLRRAYWVLERRAAIAIELTGERFGTLVLEVEDPESAAQMVNQAIADARPAT